jgi:hypothetical protein
MRGCRTLMVGAMMVLLCGCSDKGGVVYTLYRSSPTIGGISGEKARVHVATFDAEAGGDYNQDNCEAARNLFANQPGVTVKYWCERGRFEP